MAADKLEHQSNCRTSLRRRVPLGRRRDDAAAGRNIGTHQLISQEGRVPLFAKSQESAVATTKSSADSSTDKTKIIFGILPALNGLHDQSLA